MFNNNFYPTPKEVIEQMCFGLDLMGKTVLEPSAGKGDIITYCRSMGAKVVACEIHPDLALIASKKSDKFLKHDFLKVTEEEVSHINYIVMNPPFSSDEKHILHAWQIAPEGCEIVALCNWSTLNNAYTSYRQNLCDVVKKFGSSTNIGDAFSGAERKTDTSIGLVRLYKPKSGDKEFDGYFDLDEDVEGQENGIMAYDEIRDIVNRYVGAVKMFDSVVAANTAINGLIKPINSDANITFGANQRRNGSNYDITRDDFKKELQKSAWKTIFAKMNMSKYVTRSVMGDINKFVEQQVTVPFTLKNIYKMIEMIIGTHGSRMEKVLVDAFDKICSFSYENSEAGEKWKTNSSYKVNQKFILPSIVNGDWGGGYMRLNYYSSERQSDLDDVVKALCYLTGKNYADFSTLGTFISGTYMVDEDGKRMKEQNGYSDRYIQRYFSEWYVWNEFFEVKGFKKGTMHVRFRTEKVWLEFNQRVAKIKGWALPRNTDTKKKGTEKSKKTGVELF